MFNSLTNINVEIPASKIKSIIWDEIYDIIVTTDDGEAYVLPVNNISISMLEEEPVLICSSAIDNNYRSDDILILWQFAKEHFKGDVTPVATRINEWGEEMNLYEWCGNLIEIESGAVELVSPFNAHVAYGYESYGFEE